MAPPAVEPIRELLLRTIPGASPRTEQLREEIVDFVINLGAATLLMTGPSGAGKSSLAGIVAYIRRFVTVKEQEARRAFEYVRFVEPGRIDPLLLSWFAEITLTGLSETLAEAQLFGVARGAATGVSERVGVFEAAQTGRYRSSSSRHEDRGAQVTNGVVLLDEVGDLSPRLQALLLPVVAGAPYYRVGGEGNAEHELRYTGTVITATWKSLDEIRADLRYRLSDRMISVPGMSERAGDLEAVIRHQECAIGARFTRRVEDVIRADPTTDKEYWGARTTGLRPLGEAELRRFMEVDWSQHGELRGLSQALTRTIVGQERLEAVLATLPRGGGPPSTTPGVEPLVERLLAVATPELGVAECVKQVHREQRTALKGRMLADDQLLGLLARRFEIDARELRKKLYQLDRDRSRKSVE